jgi:hypothetical protein
MNPRDTRTGSVLEQMVIPALKQGRFSEIQRQAVVGSRLGGKKHRIDLLAKSPSGDRFLISLRWQQVSRTAEQKVPYEVMCLADAIAQGKGRFKRAYPVLGGSAWSLKDFFLKGGHKVWMKNIDPVLVVAL